MAEQITLGNFATLQNSSIVATLNANNTLIETAFADCLSLSGTLPNQMQSNLDMNSFQIINLPAPATLNSPIRVVDLEQAITGFSSGAFGLLTGNNNWTGTNTFSTQGVTLSSATPTSTTNTLYNVSGTLFWNGVPIETGASGTTGFISKFSSSSTLNNSIIFQSSNLIGISSSALTPDSLLTVNANTANTPGTLLGGTVFHIVGGTGTTLRAVMDSFAAAPSINFRRADGTISSPSAVQLGENIGSVTALGYGATGYGTGSRVSVQMIAAENWSDTAQGAYLTLATTATGTTTITERVRIFASGGVSIGNTTDVANLFQVAGGIAIGSYAGVNAAPSNGLIVSGYLGIGNVSNPASYSMGVTGDSPSVNGGHDQVVVIGKTNTNQQFLIGYNTTSNYGYIQAVLQQVAFKSLALSPSGGGVGIGSATGPLSVLDVFGGIAIGSYAGVNAAPSNGLIVSGAVGIGNSSPTANTLQVSVSGGVVIDTATGTMLKATSANTGQLNTVEVENTGTSSNASTFAVLKAALNVNTTYVQLYAQGGATPTASLTTAGMPFVINSATTLQFQSNGFGIADYGFSAGSTWTFGTAVTITGALKLAGGTLLATSANLTNNAAAQTATLTNGPTTGNPTKWIPINDNGTVRNIPAW